MVSRRRPTSTRQLRWHEGMAVNGDWCWRRHVLPARLRQQVIDARGDYLIVVKDNQRTLLSDIKMASRDRKKWLFPLGSSEWDQAMDTVTTLDKGHGRRERRTLKATTAWNEYLDWRCRQVGQVDSEVVRDGKTTQETRSFITSVRGGWRAPVRPNRTGARSIANRSHYVRDVTMGEDASRIRKSSGKK